MGTREVKKVLVIANSKKAAAPSLVESMQGYFAGHGIQCYVRQTDGDDSPIDVASDTDLVITLGGDGTVLYCARYLQDLGIPILAVNLGTFGYITEVSVDEWKEAFEQYVAGQIHISRRLMIRVSVYRDGKKIWQAHGLNEMVVTSSGISKVVNLDLTVNQTHAGFFRADGMIIATPTGSTGYSLAAGGPILDADLSALIVTPVCPFTLSNRPLVVNGESQLMIEIPHGQRTGLVLTVDGQQLCPLDEGDRIVVEKSRSRALLITSGRRNYIDVIREKLNWSGGMHA
ncbi:MAG: NAD(+)/NADH kinase [Sphaerochaetaceae bacterium]|jgi:NAD+ kinase